MASRGKNTFNKSKKSEGEIELTKRVKSTTSEQIKELEDRIAKTKYNKKTQHAIGLYKAKLAKLKEKRSGRGGGGGSSTDSYYVKKSGDATVILIGFPSVGKSTLLNGLTDAKSETGAYAFTTLGPVPGTMKHKYANIQILDVPGIVEGAAAGRGRGKEVLAAMRSADMALLLIDVFQPKHLKVLQKEIYDTHLRLNQIKPDVKIVKTGKGGINVGSTCKLTHLDEDTIKSVLKEFRINNADVVIREDITVDQLIDIVENNKVYIPSITVLNKIDMATEEQIEETSKLCNPDIKISATKKEHLEELKDLIFNRLNFMRVYCKEVGKPADLNVPLIMIKHSTVKIMCEKLHRDFVDKFKFSKIWGNSAKFPGQKKGLVHVMKDKDIVEIHMK